MGTASGAGDVGTTCRTAVTEVWPGEFELRIETGRGDTPTTTVHTLDAAQLDALGDHIGDALRSADG